MSRRAPGEGTVFRSADGRWEAMADLGPDPATGRRRRLHLRGATKADVTAKMRRAQEQGRGAGWRSAGDWLGTWLDVIARTAKPSTLKTYRTHVNYALGSFGAAKLASLGPEHLELLYDQLTRRGVSAVTVQGVHRTLRSAFGEAERRGLVARNPARLARPPRAETTEVVPLSLAEAHAVLAVVPGERNGARWLFALGLGLRQGEALGLCWEDIDLDAGALHVRRALCRAPWRHGCASPERCPAGRPAGCPDRVGGGLVTVEPKSTRSRRTVSLPKPLLNALRAHKRAQAAERLAAGELWEHGPHGGWVFAGATGRPTDPKVDWRQWKQLLASAGVRDARVHDARHTTATWLLAAGVDPRTVMDVMGWAQQTMATRYQHVPTELSAEATRRVADLLFGER